MMSRPIRALGQPALAPFGPGEPGGGLYPGPAPGMPGGPGGGTYGPSPLSRQGLIEHSAWMSPLHLMSWQRTGFMPGHATNILSRLAQSGCCPGARPTGGSAQDPTSYASGQRTIRCANGAIYELDNWQGGIRATLATGSPAQPGCERVHEGTWMVVERGQDAAGLGRTPRMPPPYRPGAWSWTARSGALSCRTGSSRPPVARGDGSCADCSRPLMYDGTGRAVYGTAPPPQCRPGGRCTGGLGQVAVVEEPSAIELVQMDAADRVRYQEGTRSSMKVGGLLAFAGAIAWLSGMPRTGAALAGVGVAIPVVHAVGWAPGVTHPRGRLATVGLGALAAAWIVAARKPSTGVALTGAGGLSLAVAAMPAT